MSINTMTSNAVAARSQDPNSNVDPAKVTPGGTGPLSAISNFIPTEVLTVYVAALSLVAQAQSTYAPDKVPSTLHQMSVSIFWIGLALTPLVIWSAFALKLKFAGGRLTFNPVTWPWWSTFAGTLSFAVWAMALPSSDVANYYFGSFGNLLAGIAVLVVGTILSMFAPLFAGPAPAASPLGQMQTEAS